MDRRHHLHLARSVLGDIYALQAAHYKMLKEGYDDIAYEMLLDASARGSTAALFMAGSALTASQELIDKELSEERDIISAYGLVLSESSALSHEITLKAAAHYIVAGMRGHMGRSERELKELQMEQLNRDFTKEEWKRVTGQAHQIYERIRKKRESLQLPPFEQAYTANQIVLRTQDFFNE